MIGSLRALAVIVVGACAGSHEVAEPALESRAAEEEPAAPASGSGPVAEEPFAPAATDAPGNAPDSSSVELLVGGAGPVRGRIVWVDVTWVEVTVKGIDRSPAGEPPRVRYTMRLCSEDGTTNAETYSWSQEKEYEELPDDFVFETVSDVPIHRLFHTPGGTGWDIQGTASVDDHGRVRFALQGIRLACTK